MRRRTVSLWIALLVAGAVVPVVTPPAFAAATSSYPREYAVAGDHLVFAATDGLHGMELWATDLESTWMLADIRPGTESSEIGPTTVAGDLVFFRADDGEHGPELWTTDGTPAGTRMVHDLHPGDDADIASVVPLGNDGSVVFRGDDGVTGPELWTYDAGSDTVELVADLEPGAAGSSPGVVRPFGNRALVAADTAANGREPYVTNGSALMSLGDLMPGAAGSFPLDFTDLGNGQAMFSAIGPAGREPWVTDGTPGGTSMLVDINPGGDSSPREPHPLGDGRWIFRADDGVSGSELWVTDLTLAGTELLHDINPAGGSQPSDYLTLGDQVLFAATGTDGRELWATDGTPGGLVSLGDIAAGAENSNPEMVGVIGGYGFFLAWTPERGYEMYRTDGTVAGTELFLELVPGADSSFIDGLEDGAAVLGDHLVFRALDGRGVEMWATDGTHDGTRRVSDLLPGFGATLGHGDLGDAVLADDGRLFFSAMHPLYGSELWVSDGTPEGTTVLDLLPGPEPSLAGPLAPLGDGVAFRALDADGIPQLWVSDGTVEGSMPLTSVDTPSGLIINYPTRFGDQLIFGGWTESEGSELWVTDGTPGGTRMIDLRPGTQSGNPVGFQVHDGRVYFGADDGVDGREPWTTDGTPAGTSQILDLNAGANGSQASGFTLFDGWVYFSAHDGANGTELWRTQGTPATTQMTDDIVPGNGGASPSFFTPVGDQLYFSADDADGRELWATDGTIGGAAQVADIDPGAGASRPSQLTAFGNRLLFTAEVPGTGRELWVSDTGGTNLVIDLVGGADDPGIEELVVSDGAAWFTGLDEDSQQRHLFRTDGTSEGTVVSGLPGVNPNHLVPGSLWYSAYDEVTGRGELYLASDPSSGAATQLTSIPLVDRLEGVDRFETAVKVSQDTHGSADTVVIARGDEYADALAGGPLAYHLGAPILLVRTGSLPEVTAAEIDRLGATHAVVLGGDGAVSGDVVQALVADTSIETFERVAGVDRFATAVEVADELPDSASAFVVEGINADPRRGWPDAVAVSSLASFTGQPILLTRADRLPDATRDGVADLGITDVTIVGGTAAVSAGVAGALEDAGASLAPRLSGPTRFETSLAVAAASVDAGLWEGRTWTATGLAFPDALVAGPAAAGRSAVLLLVHGQSMAADDLSAGWFTDAAPLERAVLLGGPAAISQAVGDLVGDLVVP